MIFDIVCLIIIVAGAFYGFRRGALAQIGSIAGVIFGIVCCNVFAKRLAEKFIASDDSPETELLCYVLSYVVIFVLCYLVGRCIGTLLSKIAKTLHLSPIDRICGTVFTILECTLVFSIMLNAYIGAFPNASLRTDNEKVKQFVLNFAPTVLGSPTANEVFNTTQTLVEDISKEALATFGGRLYGCDDKACTDTPPTPQESKTAIKNDSAGILMNNRDWPKAYLGHPSPLSAVSAGIVSSYKKNDSFGNIYLVLNHVRDRLRQSRLSTKIPTEFSTHPHLSWSTLFRRNNCE